MHREALTDAGAVLFPSLSRFGDFYLAGGTALALQIGHRVSVDFDLFSDHEIDRGMLQRARRVFGDRAEIIPLVNNTDELTVSVNGVKLTFLRYPFPVSDAFATYENVRLLSVPEIAGTKAYTIGRRGSYKDYVDLYFIVSEDRSTLPEIIASAEQKFGTDFNARLFLEQLVFLGDLDDTEVQFLKPIVTANEIQVYFEDRIRDIADKI